MAHVTAARPQPLISCNPRLSLSPPLPLPLRRPATASSSLVTSSRTASYHLPMPASSSSPTPSTPAMADPPEIGYRAQNPSPSVCQALGRSPATSTHQHDGQVVDPEFDSALQHYGHARLPAVLLDLAGIAVIGGLFTTSLPGILYIRNVLVAISMDLPVRATKKIIFFCLCTHTSNVLKSLCSNASSNDHHFFLWQFGMKDGKQFGDVPPFFWAPPYFWDPQYFQQEPHQPDEPANDDSEEE